MITIVKEKPSKKERKPYYELKYNYMIGDADGNTSEKVSLSADNPFIERYVKLLNGFRPLKGHWGTVFHNNILDKLLEEKQITEDDYNFLDVTMNEEPDATFEVPKEQEKFLYEFFDGVRGDTEYSFLVFQGCELSYFDEFGTKNKTKIK